MTNRQVMINELSAIRIFATPVVMTMDMGIEYDYITAEGAGSSWGNMGEWPAYKFSAITGEKWKRIRRKLEEHSAVEEDFEGTDIEAIIKSLHCIYKDMYEEFYHDVSTTFAGLLELPEELEGPFYCLLDVRAWGEKPVFFADEIAFEKAFCDSYCYSITKWEDMDDDSLRDWYERLEDDLGGLVIIDYTEDEDDE